MSFAYHKDGNKTIYTLCKIEKEKVKAVYLEFIGEGKINDIQIMSVCFDNLAQVWNHAVLECRQLLHHVSSVGDIKMKCSIVSAIARKLPDI